MINTEPSHISSNLQDYLEAIYHLQKENKVARAKDVAARVGVSRASVTNALKSLAERGLINYEPYSFVTMTETGEIMAAEIIRRHNTLREFFENVLLLDAEKSEANACRVEHAMDVEAVDRLVTFLDFFKECPRAGQDMLDAFRIYVTTLKKSDFCVQCIGDCLERVEKEEKS